MRILVIDDYAPIRESIAERLRELGFAVTEAADGEEGLWRAQQETYDVIVLDIMLPELDGFTLLARLRESSSDAFVLIVTAKDELEDRLNGLDMGADDYLTKPFALEELVSRVRALVRRKYGSRKPAIEVGSVSIDLNHKKVWVGGREVILTGREYGILELLIVRAGQIVFSNGNLGHGIRCGGGSDEQCG